MASGMIRGGVAVLLLFPLQGIAQDWQAHSLEITPQIGFRSGGEFRAAGSPLDLEVADSASYGIQLNYTAGRDALYDVFYMRQATDLQTDNVFDNVAEIDLTVEYLQAGGTYLFSRERAQPYISFTVGASRFSPGEAGLSDENFFAATIGGGYKFWMTKRLGLRLDGRAYLSAVSNESNIFCRTGSEENSCIIFADGDVLVQWEAALGLTFAF